MNKTELVQIIKDNQEIIIYGAGRVAKALIKMIKAEKLSSHILCIAVTDVVANPKDISGIEIKAIWDLNGQADKSFVVIAAFEEFQDSIQETLDLIGFKKYLKLDDGLINEIFNYKKMQSNNRFKYKKIVFYAYRDCMMGISGGPGAALFLQEKYLGDEFEGISIEYHYKSQKWPFKIMKGEFVGAILQVIKEQLFQKDTFYISNDLGTACGLALINKHYVLLFHHQGSIIKENIDYGQKMSKKKITLLHILERIVFTKAKKVCFPSNGAEEMYFDSQYRSVNKNKVQLGQPLYNTISEIKITNRIEKESDKLTFMSLGTVSSAKGQDLSLKFLEKFLQKYTRKVRYIVIGRGPMVSRVNSFALELMKIYSNFEYIYIPRIETYEEIMRIHQITDIYLMMHRISIFDLSTLEAMSSCSALVLSDVGGNIEFNVENNVILVKNENYEEATQQLLESDIEELKVKNKDVYLHYFSPEIFSSRYSQLLRKLLI